MQSPWYSHRNPRPDKVIKYGLDPIIKAAYDEGLSDSEILVEINKFIDSSTLPEDAYISHKTIQRWRARRGLPPHSPISLKKRLDEHLLEKYNEGLSDFELSKFFEVDRSTIEDWRQEHGLPTNSAVSEETKIKIVNLLLEGGHSQRSIARQCEVSANTVKRVEEDLHKYRDLQSKEVVRFAISTWGQGLDYLYQLDPEASIEGTPPEPRGDPNPYRLESVQVSQIMGHKVCHCVLSVQKAYVEEFLDGLRNFEHTVEKVETHR